MSPESLVLSVTDNADDSPAITAKLNGLEISYTHAYTFEKDGDFTLKITATDESENAGSAEVAINVGVGLPSLIGLEKLQDTVNPKTNIPIDLLL